MDLNTYRATASIGMLCPPTVKFLSKEWQMGWRASRRSFLQALGYIGAISAGVTRVIPDIVFPDPVFADAPATRPVTLTKGPFIHLTGDDSARLRFETREEIALDVRLERGQQGGVEYKPTLSTTKLRFKWPQRAVKKKPPAFPDKPGNHTLQEVSFEGLIPGERYRWMVHRGGGSEVSGTFMAPPPPDAAFRLGWIADTRQYRQERTMQRLLEESPDLVIHGGDLQYQSDKRDTWNGFFHDMAGLMRRAPTHFCVGNHEAEGYKGIELQELFLRLFQGQGHAGGQTTYHTFRYGRAQFIVLNTEDRDLAKKKGAQYRWLTATLEEAKRGPARTTVMAFHRPIFSVSKRQPPRGLRDALHPLFQKYSIPLVMTGHNHCYERFSVDGITYITDGGGGASLYDPDHNLRKIKKSEPEVLSARQHFEKAHGVCTVDFNADGTLELKRHALKGGIDDQITIPTA